MNETIPSQNSPCCRQCHHFDVGRCLMTRMAVRDDFLCLLFARQPEQPSPVEAPPRAAPPVAPLPEPKEVEAVTGVSDPPRIVRRPRFSFRAFWKDLLGINRLGALIMNFPAQSHGMKPTTTPSKGTP
jgi:hypothetical protein